MSSKSLVVTAFLFSIVLNANANPSELPNRYRTYLPVSVDCQVESKKIADRFAARTGAKVMKSTCAAFDTKDPMAPSDFSENIVTLEYTGALANPQSTYLGYTYDIGSLRPANFIGAFDTAIACETDRAVQAAMFERENGFAPVNVSCAPAENPGTFVMQFDAFTRAKKSVQVFNTAAIDGTAVVTTEVQAIAALIRAKGLPVARVAENVVFYYAASASALDLKVTYAGTLASAEQCTTQKAKLGKELDASVYVSCTEGVASTLNVTARKSAVVNASTVASAYATFSECQADEAAAAVEFKKQRGSRFLAAYCVYDGREARSPYMLNVLTR